MLEVGSQWRHYKGNIYTVLGVAVHTEDEVDLVLYHRTDCKQPKVWARPATDWYALVNDDGEIKERFIEV